jgi:hypothetical protein
VRAETDLRAAQQRTASRLYEYDETQAVLPMGGGKTASALTAFRDLRRDGFVGEMFVLAPKRVALMVWPAEPREWEHLGGLKVQVVTGTEEQRRRALAQPADIFAIGIDNTQWFVDWMKTQKPERFSKAVLCIDELSRFKNPRGKRAKALFPMMKLFFARWGLTGTPRPNGYEDQFMPMKLLTSGQLWGKSFDRWRDMNCYPLDYNGYNWAVIPERIPGIIADINKVSITIPAEEMPELPELNDGPEFIEWVDLPREDRLRYDEMERHLVHELRESRKTVVAQNMAVATGKLSQIVQGFLYTNDTEGRREQTWERFNTVKMDRLHEMIEEAGGEPVMVAYDFKADLALLQEEFPGIPWLGRGDAADIAFERQWNEGKMPIGAVHPASAGHGLNLQFGGAQLFWYGMTWSAELYDQLLKRFHRPGQHRPVWSRPILARGTIDELKYSRVTGKMSAQEAFRRLLKEV